MEWGARVAAVFVATIGCWLIGCLVDPDRPCGDDYRESSTGSCLCPAGTVPTTEGTCEEPEPEEATDDPCRPSDAGARVCERSSQCPDGQLCDVHASGTCVPAPEGLNQACTDDADCGSGAATYCETFQSRTCQIEGCGDRDGVCPGDMACCDYAVLGRSLCVPASELEGGSCPAPGQLVPRR